MRPTRILMVATAILAVLFGAASASEEQLSHFIFCKVNGKTITQENVQQAADYIVRREYNNTKPQDQEELVNIQQAAVRDLIRTILIHDEAATLGIKVSRDSSRRAIRNSGMKPEEISPTIRRMLEADDLFEEVMMHEGTPVSQPTPKQMRDFYNQNRDQFRMDAFIIVRTIFIAEDGRRPQSYFKQRAEQVKYEIESLPVSMRTDAFDKKAREISEDAFKQFGGLLTGDSAERWIPKEFRNTGPNGKPIFPESMAAEIRRLSRKGEVRLAVSEDGMHLLYCEDVRGGNVVPWDEAKRIIDYVLRQRARNRLMRSWMNRVYEKSDVRWNDGSTVEKELLTKVLLPSERSAANN